MLDSEAFRTDTGSPRDSSSSKWRRIIDRRMPRRRWVGSTEMAVRPPTGTVVSPGRVRSIESAPPVPTMRSPSKAAMLRSYSNPSMWSASSASSMVSPNATPMTAANSRAWSGVIGLISMSMGAVVLDPGEPHTWFTVAARSAAEPDEDAGPDHQRPGQLGGGDLAGPDGGHAGQGGHR